MSVETWFRILFAVVAVGAFLSANNLLFLILAAVGVISGFWPALKAAYRLPLAAPSGLDHGLAYDAISAAAVFAARLVSMRAMKTCPVGL